MVYISGWHEFQVAAEDLYAKSPKTTRYCVKFKTVEGKGKLVLKITDDVTCIKFKTFSSIFLNRFEALNLTLIQKMQNVDPAQIAEPIAAAASTGASTLTAVDAGASGSAPVAAAAPSVGGVKKKKAKKKK